MLVGLIQASLILLVAQFWFRISFAGSYFILYLSLIEFLAASVGIGLFISSIAKNMQQAIIGSVIVLMPFMLMSGLTTPIMNMPVVIQYLTSLNPLRYAKHDPSDLSRSCRDEPAPSRDAGTGGDFSGHAADFRIDVPEPAD